MDEQRKYAYRSLLCRAMLDIRWLQWFRWWPRQPWNPSRWLQLKWRIQHAGAVADWLHNLAFYSSIDFRGFDEVWFWREFEQFRSRFPGCGVEHYREDFEQQAHPPSEAPDREPSRGLT